LEERRRTLRLTWLVELSRFPPHFRLFATGLAALGLLGWRRKRKQQRWLREELQKSVR
jgi:MYXO-CTERM domain-containing protein